MACPFRLAVFAVSAILLFQMSAGFEWIASSPPDGATVEACMGEKVSFPWMFFTAPDETVLNIEWYKQTDNGSTLIAQLTGIFVKVPTTNMTVGFLPNAGITISNYTLKDFGLYNVTVNYNQSGDTLSQSTSVVLALPEAPILSGGRLVARVQPDPVTDVITGEKRVQLTCGTFQKLGSRPLSVEWRTPSGETLNSTFYADGNFHLTLPNPVVSGYYVCRLQDPTLATRCVKNVLSAFKFGAHVLVDKDEARLMFLEDGVRNLRDKDQAVDVELDRLRDKDDNLTSDMADVVTKIDAGVQGLRDKVNETDVKLNKLQDKDSSLTSELADLQTNVKDLRDKDQTVDVELDRLQEKDSRLTSDLDSFRQELEKKMERNVNDLREKDQAVDAELDKLRGKDTRLTSDIADLRRQADTNLTSGMADMRQNLHNLRQELRDITIRRPSDIIALIEEQLKEYRLCWAGGHLKFQLSCYNFVEQKVTWVTAKEICRQLGGKLAEVDSAEENEFLMKIALSKAESGYMWLGATDSQLEGRWVLGSSGNALLYTKWYRGEPNNKGRNEHCLMTWKEKTWNDTDCNDKLPFVCERSLE